MCNAITQLFYDAKHCGSSGLARLRLQAAYTYLIADGQLNEPFPRKTTQHWHVNLTVRTPTSLPLQRETCSVSIPQSLMQTVDKHYLRAALASRLLSSSRVTLEISDANNSGVDLSRGRQTSLSMTTLLALSGRR